MADRNSVDNSLEKTIEGNAAGSIKNSGNLGASRREVLRLGAAGLPMVYTLSASASEAVISQLRCTMLVPAGMVLLIHRDGSVWAPPSGGSVR